MTTKPLTTADVPTSVLMRWLEILTPDSESACIYRRELDRRYGERDEQIGERQAAQLLGVPRDMLRRIASRGLIRPIREYAFEYRFSRREIERWAAWTSQEGMPR